MKSKTIILSAEDTDLKNGRGILTIYSEDDLLKCRLRLYNIKKLTKYCKLGIYHNQQVYSANLLEKNGVYESSFVGSFNIDQDFYTAIVDTSINNKVIVSGGTYAGHFFNDNTIFHSQQEQENEVIEKIEFDQPKVDLINPICNKDEIAEHNCNKCEKCIYKDYFYTHQENTIKEENISQGELATQRSQTTKKVESIPENFLSSLISQFNIILESYPTDEDLTKKIAHSKFVKINEDNEQYSIGAIFENDTIKYLCYAVKCNYNSPKPEAIGNHYQWMPLNAEDPLSDGYYLVFQDTTDLKILQF